MTETDLSWLATAEAVETEWREPLRGRYTGPNPMDGHVLKAHDGGKPVAISIPAKEAKKVERLTRNSIENQGKADKDAEWGWTGRVQFMTEHPEKAGREHLIPLGKMNTLADDADVWISIRVANTAKPVDLSNIGENPADEKVPGGTDPFAGQPTTTKTGKK